MNHHHPAGVQVGARGLCAVRPAYAQSVCRVVVPEAEDQVWTVHPQEGRIGSEPLDLTLTVHDHFHPCPDTGRWLATERDGKGSIGRVRLVAQ